MTLNDLTILKSHVKTPFALVFKIKHAIIILLNVIICNIYHIHTYYNTYQVCIKCYSFFDVKKSSRTYHNSRSSFLIFVKLWKLSKFWIWTFFRSSKMIHSWRFIFHSRYTNRPLRQSRILPIILFNKANERKANIYPIKPFKGKARFDKG